MAKGRAKAATAAKKQVQKEKAEADRGAKRVAADERLRSKVRLASKPEQVGDHVPIAFPAHHHRPSKSAVGYHPASCSLNMRP